MCWQSACSMDTIKCSQLSIIDVWNQQIQEKDNIIIATEYIKKVLSSFDYSILFNVISQFTELRSKLMKNKITFLL